MLKKHLRSIVQAFSVATAALLAASFVHAETVTLAPAGEFKKIDIRLVEGAINALLKGSADEKQNAIAQVKAAPERYAPLVFYVLGSRRSCPDKELAAVPSEGGDGWFD